MDEIRIGDVVQLKSGGPLMTVESIDSCAEGAEAVCQWFVKGDAKNQVYNLATLRKVRQ